MAISFNKSNMHVLFGNDWQRWNAGHHYFNVCECWTILVLYCLFILTSFHHYIFRKRNKGFCTFTCTLFSHNRVIKAVMYLQIATLTPLHHESIVKTLMKISFWSLSWYYYCLLISFSLFLQTEEGKNQWLLREIRDIYMYKYYHKVYKTLLTSFKCKIKDNFFYIYVYSIMLH